MTIHRIRQRSALHRQVQMFFHEHLVGVYSWEDVQTRRAEPVKRETKPNGTPLPFEAGKFRDKVEIYFGPFDLVALGPYEDDRHPCGLIRCSTPRGSCEGPLDATTWQKIGDFIKQNKQEEVDHGRESGTHWGR